MVSGVSKSLIPRYATPNEGIRRSIRNGFASALIAWLIFGLIGVGLISVGWGGELIVLWLSIIGPAFGLAYGLGAAAQHGILRMLLAKYRMVPLRYVRWLNYTVHLRLLYRSTDGGYVFIHRIVQE